MVDEFSFFLDSIRIKIEMIRYWKKNSAVVQTQLPLDVMLSFLSSFYVWRFWNVENVNSIILLYLLELIYCPKKVRWKSIFKDDDDDDENGNICTITARKKKSVIKIIVSRFVLIVNSVSRCVSTCVLTIPSISK